jgi:hypothetical protein
VPKSVVADAEAEDEEFPALAMLEFDEGVIPYILPLAGRRLEIRWELLERKLERS